VHKSIKIQILRYSYQKINNLEDILSIISKKMCPNKMYNIL